MIMAQSLPTHPQMNASFEGERRGDAEHLNAAERELSAFVAAVAKLFGQAAADRAAECWVALAESVELPPVEGCLNWRRITIRAASHMAIERRASAA